MSPDRCETGPIAEQLRPRIQHVLESNSIGRYHPAHVALVDGDLSAGQLQQLLKQQWHFHRLFAYVLRALQDATSGTRAEQVVRALATSQSPTAPESPLMLWTEVCSDLGVSIDELVQSEADEATTMMVSAQQSAAQAVHPVGFLAIMIGVYVEATPWLGARRSAFERSYGASASSLRYFGNITGTPVPAGIDDVLVLVEPVDEPVHDLVVEHLKRVLRARWRYFSAIHEVT